MNRANISVKNDRIIPQIQRKLGKNLPMRENNFETDPSIFRQDQPDGSKTNITKKELYERQEIAWKQN